MRELETDGAGDRARTAGPRRRASRPGAAPRMLPWLAGPSGESRHARSYHELDEHLRTLIDSMRGEPDLAARTESLAAVARGERELARLYAREFPPSVGAGRHTRGQVDALVTSAELIDAIVVATRGALGARVVLASWTEAPWDAAAPALRRLAGTTDPAARARALDEIRGELSAHLDQTATESLVDLVEVERAHSVRW